MNSKPFWALNGIKILTETLLNYLIIKCEVGIWIRAKELEKVREKRNKRVPKCLCHQGEASSESYTKAKGKIVILHQKISQHPYKYQARSMSIRIKKGEAKTLPLSRKFEA